MSDSPEIDDARKYLIIAKVGGVQGGGGGGEAGVELRFTDDILYYGRITSYGCFTELTIQSSVT